MSAVFAASLSRVGLEMFLVYLPLVASDIKPRVAGWGFPGALGFYARRLFIPDISPLRLFAVTVTGVVSWSHAKLGRFVLYEPDSRTDGGRPDSCILLRLLDYTNEKLPQNAKRVSLPKNVK